MLNQLLIFFLLERNTEKQVIEELKNTSQGISTGFKIGEEEFKSLEGL